MSMRVMFVLAGGHYGTFHIGSEFLKASLKAGFDPVLVTGEEGTMWHVAREAGIRAHVRPIYGHTYDVHKAVGLAKLIRAEKADVVHTQLAFPSSFIVRVAGALAHVPVLEHAMTTLAWHPNPFIARVQRVLQRRVSRFGGLIVTMSGHLRDQYLEAGVSGEVVRVIHHGVDVAGVDLAGSDPSPQVVLENQGCKLVVFVGHLSQVKGQRFAIEALGELKGKYEDLRLVLVGSDSMTHLEPGYEKELRTTAASLDVTDQVIFAGHLPRSEVWTLLHHSFALMHLPEAEGFGAVVPEAMAARLPVIVSDVGGPREIVRNEQDGFVVTPEDGAAAALALDRLLDSPSMAREMGERGRQRVLESFSLSEIHQRVFRIYFELVNREHPEASVPRIAG